MRQQSPWEKKYELARKKTGDITQQWMCATMKGKQVMINVEIKGHKLRALIDSGATVNAISPATADRCAIRQKRKEQPYQLQMVDGEEHSHNSGTMDKETRELNMRI